MPVTVREATAADNAGLVELARACTMRGGMGLRIERAPDFFALSRLFGDPWKVFLAADEAGRVTGCTGVAFRSVYLRSEVRTVAYLSDVKIHPDHRGPASAADALIGCALDACRDRLGGGGLMFFTIMKGNRHAEKWSPGLRGLPPLTHFSAVDAWAVPLLWAPPPRHTVEPAGERDADEMMALWRRLAPEGQFAQAFEDGAAFGRWLERAGGLDLSGYRLVRDGDGRLLGFWGLWDQQPLKQLRVVEYARNLAVPRLAFNTVARLMGAVPLPPPGGELRALNAVHLCTPRDDPGVLRSLVLSALREWRGRGFSTLNLSLDERDGRRAALRGLFAQPTRVHGYATTPDGGYGGPALDDRPFHHEVALV